MLFNYLYRLNPIYRKIKKLERINERFQSIDQREYLSCFNLLDKYNFFRKIQEAKGNRNNKIGVKWKNEKLQKDPFTLSLYLSLLQELMPKTVIEIGSGVGASAVWFHDMLRSLEIEAKVYSYDIDLDQIMFHGYENITFIGLDCEKIETEFKPPKMIQRPLLIIEDSHLNIKQVLTTLYNYMEKGDYMVIEDTHIYQKVKYIQLVKFLENYKNEIFVDSYYTDNFGYNMSWEWNSFLKKVK